MSIENHLLTDWFTHLSWYQYIGELIAILLYLLTFTSEKLIHFPKKLNFKLIDCQIESNHLNLHKMTFKSIIND